MSDGWSKPTAIDAFAGCGGLSLGLLQAGFDVRVAFDINRPAVLTYEQNIESRVLLADARQLSGAALLNEAGLAVGECTLFAGGPPCQGFSVQRRDGAGDWRNRLLVEFLRLVAEIQPVFFLLENVEGLKGARSRVHFDELLGSASGIGYDCEWRMLDAADFGVPQFRRRLCIVGERDTFDRPSFRFPPRPAGIILHRTVREAIGDLPEPPLDHSPHLDWPDHRRMRISELNRLRISYVPEGGGWEYIPEHLRVACHCPGAARIGHRYVYGRMCWDTPAPTITARFDSFTRGKFAHPGQNRTITLREGARLQTFPDWFTFYGTQEEIASQIGNAVPPVMAEAIGLALLQATASRSAADGASTAMQLNIAAAEVAG